MSEMVERVAQSIYEGRNGAGCRAWRSLPQAHRDPYRKDAFTAINTMREPTDEMLSAADSAIPRFEAEPDGSRLMGVDGARDAWSAMIAEALLDPTRGEG